MKERNLNILRKKGNWKKSRKRKKAGWLNERKKLKYIKKDGLLKARKETCYMLLKERKPNFSVNERNWNIWRKKDR